MKGLILRNALIIFVLLALMSGLGVLAEGPGTVEFSNISDGTVISELTTIQGTIEFPEFLKYEVYLKNGDNMIWTGNSHSPVVNGNLIRLDPRMFNNGDYQVIVRKVYPNSQYSEVEGPVITIDNPNGAALPYYPEVEPSFLYPSAELAIIRAKNCAGEEFKFDYQSPGYSGSSGNMTMPGKNWDGICYFTDFAVIPAHYSGTGQGGAQAEGQPVEFDAFAGKVYEIVYVGGGHRITGQEVAADEMHTEAVETTKAPSAGSADKTQETLPTTGEEAPAAEVAPPAPQAAPTKVAPAPAETILPETGNRMEQGSVFALISVLVIVFLVGGGLLAVSKRKQPL